MARTDDCLNLHTARKRSGLPGLAFAASVRRCPSRADVIAYLDACAAHHHLTCRFKTEAMQVAQAPGRWTVTCRDSEADLDGVVIATRLNGQPDLPRFAGQNRFDGTIRHAAGYGNPAAFQGQNVAVVGFGNSGEDVALDLARAGKITVRTGIAHLTPAGAAFADMTRADLDALIAATGDRVDLRPLLGARCAAPDPEGRPVVSGAGTAVRGLYFCSFKVAANGQLWAAGRATEAIAKDLAAQFALATATGQD